MVIKTRIAELSRKERDVKKCAARAKLLLLQMRRLDFFVCVFVLPFSLPSSFSITRLYFYVSKLSNVVTRASLLALAKSVC